MYASKDIMNTCEGNTEAHFGPTYRAPVFCDDIQKVEKPSLNITTVANKLLLAAERQQTIGESGPLIPKLLAEGSYNELQWERPNQEDSCSPTSSSYSNSVDGENMSQDTAKYLLIKEKDISQIKNGQSVAAMTYMDFVPHGNGSPFSYGYDTSVSNLQQHMNENQALIFGQPNDSSPKRLHEIDKRKEVPAKKPKYRPSRPPLLPPCRVCADRASGFHYGVNTCEACKGFFRRSLCKKVPYTCVGDGDCKLVHGKRTACSACRFKRCLEVGMSKDAIKTGRYTHELRSKNILEVKQLQTQLNEHYLDVTSETRMRKDGTEDVDSLKCIVNTLVNGQNFLHEFLEDYFNDELILERQRKVNNRYLRERAMDILKLNRIDDLPSNDDSDASLSDKGRQDEAHDRSEVVKTKEDVPHNSDIMEKSFSQSADCKDGIGRTEEHNGFEKNKNVTRQTQSNLPSHTVQTLPKCDTNNHSSITASAHAQKAQDVEPEVEEKPLFSEGKKAEVLLQIIKDMERGVHGMLSFAKSLPGFEDLHKDDQVTLVKAARFDIWYIGHIRCFNTELRVGVCEWEFHAEELMQVWGKDIVELAFVLSRLGQRLDLSIEETAALRAVSLTFPDRCYPLQDRKSVEIIHERMLQVFKYVSSQRRKNYNTWFTKVIDFLVLLREFGISFEKVSNNLTLDWSVLKTNPLLLAVFLS